MYEVCKLDYREDATARLGPIWYFAIHLSYVAPSFIAAKRDPLKARGRLSKGMPCLFYEEVINPFTFRGQNRRAEQKSFAPCVFQSYWAMLVRLTSIDSPNVMRYQ